MGKTAVAIALAERLRARGEDPVAVSADALQVYAGLRDPHRRGDRRRSSARLEHRLVGFLPVDETFSAGAYARRAHAEIDALLAAGRRPIVVGGTGLYLRAALAELDLRPPVARAIRDALDARSSQRSGAPALHAELARRAPGAAAGDRARPTRQRIVRALELLDAGATRRPPGATRSCGPTDTRHPTLLAGADRWTARRSTRRIDARVDAMVAAGAREEVRARRRGGRLGHRAPGARLRASCSTATSRP